jgi:glycosyltransferase involved in cell wall biosynthesis
MSTIISHPTGNRNFRYLITALSKKKKLKLIFTNLNINSKSKFFKYLPKIAKLLIQRRDFGNHKNVISISPKFELIRVFLTKFNGGLINPINNNFFSNHINYARFSKLVVRKIKILKNTKNIYAYEGAAIEIFTEAKKKQIKCIYELPTLYWKEKENIYKKEKKKHPKYKRFFISEDKIKFAKRVDKEIQLADQIIVPSNQVKESLKLHPKKKLNIKVINYPFGKFIKSSEKDWYNKKRKLKILFVGMLEARKGIHHIIETLKLLKKNNQLKYFHITVIGNGTMINNIKNDWKEVEFFPFMPNELILKRMKTSDIFLSLSSFEGYALTPIEAMSMGMVVICSKFCGFTDRCNKNDVIELSDVNARKVFNSIIKLKNNPNLIKRIGTNALKTCNKYQLSDYKNNLSKII